MVCQLSEDELLSGIDREAPEVAAHIRECPSCRIKAESIREGIAAVTTAGTPVVAPLPERIGSYKIIRRLGHGGMGIVFEGEQQAPRRLVAVKVIRGGPYVDSYRLRLFEREAQTLARLKHPAIAAIYEGGRTGDGQPYFAMELVNGLPLNEYTQSLKLGRRQRLELFMRTCDAINYAHQRGVIHRDLKPSNILIDQGGNPKILDFGLARIREPDGTLATFTRDGDRMMGTLPYMSPEEARGNPDDADVRSDVYSLGVVLFELLTDQLPYAVSRAALPEAIRVICDDPPRRPSSVDRTLRGDLDTIVLKSLEKEPGRRYQTAAALGEDIQRFLSHQPIRARRSGVAYRLRKLVVRHQFVCLVIGLVVLVLGGAGWWVLRGERAFQEQTQRNAELQELREAALEFRLAQASHKLDDYAKAEQGYRAAMDKFDRFYVDDSLAEARAGLGLMMLERGDPADFEEVHRLLISTVTALDELGEHAPLGLREQALAGLRKLYETKSWENDGDSKEEFRKELEALERKPPEPMTPVGRFPLG